MAEVLLFHHPLGLTAGRLAFADELGAGGHLVHVPDLDEGRTFTGLTEGDRHLFTDRSIRDHDAVAAALVRQRVLAFLDRVG